MKRSVRTVVAVVLVGLAALGAVGASPTAGAQQGGDGGEVVGGVAAAAGEFPFAVAIESAAAPAGLGQFCGGSLLSTTRVLTAAHCVDTVGAATIAVRVGTHLLNSGGQQIGVRRINIHRGWNPTTDSNDLAVLDLETPVTLSGTIQTIRTPRRNQSVAPPGTLSTVVGWGSTAQGSPGTVNLMKASFPVLANADCSNFGSAFRVATMLCAGVLAGGTDACQGDSGGPLSVNPTGTRYQVGIVSWGIGCAQPGFPGVYTRLSTYAGNNDGFASASRVPNNGGRLNSRNYLATRQAGEPRHAASNRGGGSVWFVWTAGRTGRVRINTFGSNFDTLLGVYRGASLGGLTGVARNNDAPGSRQSQVRFRAARGTTYRIAVDGFNGDIGNVTLRVAYS